MQLLLLLLLADDDDDDDDDLDVKVTGLHFGNCPARRSVVRRRACRVRPVHPISVELNLLSARTSICLTRADFASSR